MPGLCLRRFNGKVWTSLLGTEWGTILPLMLRPQPSGSLVFRTQWSAASAALSPICTGTTCLLLVLAEPSDSCLKPDAVPVRSLGPVGPVKSSDSTMAFAWKSQQPRRLQSLKHALKAGSHATSALEYRSSLWGSICSARGFRGGFLNWWPTRPHRLVGSPAFLTHAVPEANAIGCISEDFRCNFRRLESCWHLENRSRILQSKYDASMAQVFQELRDPAPERLRHFGFVANCTWNLPSTFAGPPPGLWTVPLWRSLPMKMLCAPYLLLRSGVPERLEQTQVLSAVSDLHHEFTSLWASRWQKHATHTASHWQRFLDFAAAFLPRYSLSLPDITCDTWLQAVRRFKPGAARGPDGCTKQDLLQMPRARVEQLLAFLVELETDSRPWPQQMVTGFVCLLRKGNGRTDVHGFRPICLYSIVYRTWAGLRSRQILGLLRPLLPEDLHGFVPGREPTSLWYGIQAEVELSVQGDARFWGYPRI